MDEKVRRRTIRRTSPRRGEVAPKARVRGRFFIERSYPRTPTLSPWEREFGSILGEVRR